ncbi:phosphotransferase family protein [Pseudactinotalea sp.]|uniref:phosphotransferase family protein n=1 Tax=Pseudactinotalea sp. TaxID=1926260 RepID=UPI003B3BA252
MPTSAVPTEVEHAVADLVGDAEARTPLGGMSGRVVLAVRGRRDVVVKGPVQASEAAVAGALGARLRRHGVPVPVPLDVVSTATQGTWLVLEYLPDPLPRHRWGADPAALALLSRLHHVPARVLDTLTGRYLPRWDDEMTVAASAVVELGAHEGLLRRLQERWRAATAAGRVVSGDPNPLNWRLSGDGEPILLDWERLTLASPALDLAIMLPGLPTPSQATAIARAYERAGGDVVDGTEVLVAKVFTVLELAAAATPGSAAFDAVRGVAPDLSRWMGDAFG